jgi:hypothetical protein
MAYKRKYQPGDVVSSLDELASQEFVYIHNKIYHCGWWASMQFRLVKRLMNDGHIRKAERIGEDGEF